MSDSWIFWVGTIVPLVISYAVAFALIWWRRRGERRVISADRERSMLDRIGCLEGLLAASRESEDYWRKSLARHSDLASESLRIINDLKRENEAMARKTLTEAQLQECLDAGGTVCPRCGDDDDNLSTEDLVVSDDEAGIYTQDVTCGSCNEEFRLVFTLTKVEPIED